MNINIDKKFANLAQFEQITDIQTKERGAGYVAEVRVKINGEGYTIRVFSKDKMSPDEAQKKIEQQIEKVIILTTRFMHDGVSKIFIDKDIKQVNITKTTGVRQKEVKLDFEKQKEVTQAKSQPKIEANENYQARLVERIKRIDKAAALRDVNKSNEKEIADLEASVEDLKKKSSEEQQHQAEIIDALKKESELKREKPDRPLPARPEQVPPKPNEKEIDLAEELEKSEDRVDDLEEQITDAEKKIERLEDKRDSRNESTVDSEEEVEAPEDEEPAPIDVDEEIPPSHEEPAAIDVDEETPSADDGYLSFDEEIVSSHEEPAAIDVDEEITSSDDEYASFDVDEELVSSHAEPPSVANEHPAAAVEKPISEPKQEPVRMSEKQFPDPNVINEQLAKVRQACPRYMEPSPGHESCLGMWKQNKNVMLELKEDSKIDVSENGWHPNKEDQEDFVAALERDFRATFNQEVNKHPLRFSDDTLKEYLDMCRAFAENPPFARPQQKEWYDIRKYVQKKAPDPYAVFKAKMEEAMPRMIACYNLYRCLPAEKLDLLYPDEEGVLQPTEEATKYILNHHAFIEDLILGPHVEAMLAENRLILMGKYYHYLYDHRSEIPDASEKLEQTYNEIDRLMELSLEKGVLHLRSDMNRVIAARKHEETLAGRAGGMVGNALGALGNAIGIKGAKGKPWYQTLESQIEKTAHIERVAAEIGLETIEAQARKAQGDLVPALAEITANETEQGFVDSLKERFGPMASQALPENEEASSEEASSSQDLQSRLDGARSEIDKWIKTFTPGTFRTNQFDGVALKNLQGHIQVLKRIIEEGDAESRAEAVRICESVYGLFSNPKIKYEQEIKEDVEAFKSELGGILAKDLLYIKRELDAWIYNFTPGKLKINTNTIEQKDVETLMRLLNGLNSLLESNDRSLKEEAAPLLEKTYALLNNKGIKCKNDDIKERLNEVSKGIENRRAIPEGIERLHQFLDVPRLTYPAEQVYAIAKEQYGADLVERVAPMLFGNKAELTRKELVVLMAAMAVFVRKEDLDGKSLEHFREMERGVSLMASLGIPFDPIKFTIDENYLKGLSRAQKGTLRMLADIESHSRWDGRMRSSILPAEAEAGLRRFAAAEKGADTLFHSDKYANILVVASQAAALMRHAQNLPKVEQERLKREVLLPVTRQLRTLTERGLETYGPQKEPCLTALRALDSFITTGNIDSLEREFSINPKENPLLFKRHIEAYDELHESEYLASKVANIRKWIPQENRALCEGMLFTLSHEGKPHLFEVAATVARNGFGCQILTPVDWQDDAPVPVKLAFEGITKKSSLAQCSRALTENKIVEMANSIRTKKPDLGALGETLSRPGESAWNENGGYKLISKELRRVVAGTFKGKQIALECTGKDLGAADAQYAASHIANRMQLGGLENVASLKVKTFGGYGISQEAADRFRTACIKDPNAATRYAVFHNVVTGGLLQLMGESCLTTDQPDLTYFLESTTSDVGLKGENILADLLKKVTSSAHREHVTQFSNSAVLMQYRLLHPSSPRYAYYTERLGRRDAEGKHATLIKHLNRMKAYSELPEIPEEPEEPSQPLDWKEEVKIGLQEQFLRNVAEMTSANLNRELRNIRERSRKTEGDKRRQRDIQKEINLRQRMTPRQVRQRVMGLNRGGLKKAGMALAQGIVIGKPQRLLENDFEL